MVNFLAYGLFLIVTARGTDHAPPPTAYPTEGECLTAGVEATAKGNERGWRVQAQCFDLEDPDVQRYLKMEAEIRSGRK